MNGQIEAVSKGFWKGPEQSLVYGPILTPWFGTDALDLGVKVW